MDKHAHDIDDVANNTNTVGGGDIDNLFNEGTQLNMNAETRLGRDFHTIIGDVGIAEQNVIVTTPQPDMALKQEFVLLSKQVLLEMVALLVNEEESELLFSNTECLPSSFRILSPTMTVWLTWRLNLTIK